MYTNQSEGVGITVEIKPHEIPPNLADAELAATGFEPIVVGILLGLLVGGVALRRLSERIRKI